MHPYLLYILLQGILLVHSSSSSKFACSDPRCVGDPLGFEAVVQLHGSIDDDHNGNLDRSESNEYFRDELKHEDGAARQATFHGADDLISVHDLWKLWTHSEVYNWTVEDTVFWLEEEVGLPAYSKAFRVNAVDGHILPRIAVNGNYVTNILDIRNAVHRQKLAVKATDLVLFGQKPKGHSWIKDLLLLILLAVATCLYYLVRQQKVTSAGLLRKMNEELASLQTSEDALKTLQHRYELTKKEHLETAIEKQRLEEKLADEVSQAKGEAERLRTTRETTEEEISRLKLAELELVEVRKALAESERCCEQLRLEVPPLLELQQWLQLCYEIETQHYEAKKEAAERQLRLAREMCERIRRKRTGLLGSLRIAHTTSMDDTDQSIMQARGALEEVRLHLQERSQRWQEIENLCGFDIIHNPGLHVLETSLRGVGNTFLAGSACGSGSGLSKSSSVSTFSTMSTLPLDTELDEDLTAGHMVTASLLSNPHPVMTYPSNHGNHGSSLSIAGGPSHPPLATGGGGGLVRTYPDRRVWPNLMKAGMQLTMFGLGLTNPNLGGGAGRGGVPADPKRRTLVDSVSQAALMRGARTMPVLPSDVGARNGGRDLTGAEGVTDNDETGPSKPVTFNLGEDSASLTSVASTTSSQLQENNKPASYSKSKSLENSSAATGTATADRPQTLLTSQSDSLIQTSRASPPHKSPPVSPEEAASSHGSTDSLDVVSGNDAKKSKKRSSKISKLFKKKDT